MIKLYRFTEFEFTMGDDNVWLRQPFIVDFVLLVRRWGNTHVKSRVLESDYRIESDKLVSTDFIRSFRK